VLTEPPRSGYSLTLPFSSGLNLAPKPYVSMNMQAGLAWTVLVVEAAGVVMLVLTAALLWQRRA
jgi:hypothetical protein